MTITCYKHTGCNLFVNEGRAPPDLEIFKWLFEVPPSDPSASKEERKELAKRHTTLAKARWSNAPQQAA